MGVLFANPLNDPTLFDVINIAGVINPGLFKLDGGSRPYKWDLKDTAGAQGATITYRGLRPSEDIKGEFLFWTKEQIDEFYNNFIQLLEYDATKKDPKPVDVLHPVLAANDITSVVVKEIGPLTHKGQQLWSVTVEFIEYRPAKKKNVTATPKNTLVDAASAIGKNISNFFFGDGTVGNKPTAQTALEKDNARLLELANSPTR